MFTIFFAGFLEKHDCQLRNGRNINLGLANVGANVVSIAVEAGSLKQCNVQRTDQTAFFWRLPSQISLEK